MFRRVVLLMSIITLGMVTGCSQRIGDFTTISTKNVEIGAKYVKIGTFEGEDKAWMILVIPTGVPNVKEAVDRCLENGGGELATNAVLYYNTLPLILVNNYGYVLKADVWKRASVSDLSNPTKQIFEVQMRPDGYQELISVNDKNLRYRIFDKTKEATHQVTYAK